MKRVLKSDKKSFLIDFAGLEEALSGDDPFPAERLIVELQLTPRRVAIMNRRAKINLSWFHDIYAAMCRHALEPRSSSWSSWLRRYQTKRRRCMRSRGDRTPKRLRSAKASIQHL